MSTVSWDRFRNALHRMAEGAHDAIAYVGYANYGHREAEAHRRINELLEAELAKSPLDDLRERGPWTITNS